jgi:neopullulanase
MHSIGEAWINDAADLSFFQGGRTGWEGIDPGIDTLFDFPLNLALVDVTSNKASAAKLGKALSRDFLYPHPEWLVTFLDNHDTHRLASAPNVTPARHRLAAAFLLTSRGIPQLSWGDEIGLGGHGDDRRTIPGGWPGDPRSAFAKPGRTDEEHATFEAFQSLLKLRKDHPALRRGTTTELLATDAVLAFSRQTEGERLLIILNFGTKTTSLPLPADAADPGAEFERLYGEGRSHREAAITIIEVRAEQAVVFRVR